MTTDFASESGHWYQLDGTPCYTVQGKNGERPTTLRDARKMGLVPSVTTIIRQAAAPGLERWKAEQLLLAALTLPRRPHEPEASWIDRVHVDSRAQGRAAADRGTAIHGAIEASFRRQPFKGEFVDWVGMTRAAIVKHCGVQEWSTEKSFAHPLGYGGKPDLHSPAWLLDIKTKDGVEDAKLWDEHPMQLAPYRRAVCPGARCAIVFVDRSIACAKFVEVPEDELVRGLGMFDSLLAFWYARTGLRLAA